MVKMGNNEDLAQGSSMGWDVTAPVFITVIFFIILLKC